LSENDKTWEVQQMHTTVTRRVAVLVLTALMIAATVFGFASAIAATDADAGTRVDTSSGTREST
jgi:predicted DNA repair protein MutK